MQFIEARNVNQALPKLMGLLLARGRGENDERTDAPRVVLTERVCLTLHRPTECMLITPYGEVNPIYRLAVALYEHCELKDYRWLNAFNSGDFYDDNLIFNPNISGDFIKTPDMSEVLVLSAKLDEAELLGHLLSRVCLELGLLAAVSCHATNNKPGRLSVFIDELWIDAGRHIQLIEMARSGRWTPRDPYDEALPKSSGPDLSNEIKAIPIRRVLPLISKDRNTYREEARLLLSSDQKCMGITDPFLKRVAQPLLWAMRLWKAGEYEAAATEANQCADYAFREAALSWMEVRRHKYEGYMK